MFSKWVRAFLLWVLGIVDPEPFQIGTVRIGETSEERWAFWCAAAAWAEGGFSKAFFHDIEREYQKVLGDIMDLPIDGTYDKKVLRLMARASALEYVKEFPNRARSIARRYETPAIKQSLGDPQARKE